MLLNAFPRLATLASLIGLLSAGGCASSPTPPSGSGSCGNGTVSGSEECDDGNTVAGDGCDPSCKKEAVCGDGNVDQDEECDDGNAIDGDGCTACVSDGAPGCGNGVVDPGEQCDDSNVTSGDGCDATCKKEAGPGCGNGFVDQGEQCDDGNLTNGDGCDSNCFHTPVPEVVCQALAPLPQGTCDVKVGDDARLIVGTVLAPGVIYRGGQVLVDNTGVIVNVGCDCSTAPDQGLCDAVALTATKITCPTGVISPALINTHDHITFTQNDPYTDTGERYEHRHDWRTGKNGHTEINTPGSATNDEVAWGELRFLMGGATSTVGSGSINGLLRNLDKAAQEGLGQDQVNYQTFPLGDSNGTQLASGCGYPNIISETSIMGDDAFFPHVAEGIDGFAENEFICMSSSTNGGQDLLQQQSAFIHSIGLLAPDYAAMAVDGTSLIWSPRSNITLYGDTAVVTQAARLGVLIALGTDWVATGSMNMLRELRCADDLNKKHFGGYFSDYQLWLMATANGAAATATDDVIGVLLPNTVADISIFNGKVNADYRAIIDAQPADVTLVMRGGKVLYGDETLVAAIGGSGPCDTMDVCGSSKQVCLMDELGKNLASLTSSVGGIYPAFFCTDPPMNEPSCAPRRPVAVNGSSIYEGMITAEDGDGDGIANATDICPLVFNPIRPLDKGKQADFDADGAGDACDVCPLDANTTTCKVFDPNDSDGDGKPNISDNCPNQANPTQDDADGDQKGDVCDPCPNQANPGAQACLSTIYDIKTGVTPVGAEVALDNVLVTGRAPRGFFLQVKASDPGYMGSDNSGVFVYDPTNVVGVGDRVSITKATVADYFGQIQLTGPITTINMPAAEAPPDPVKVTSAEIATGGAKATALEAVIVEVATVTVTDAAPTPAPSDTPPTNEFVVDDGSGGVRVNDMLFLTSPLPELNDTFTFVSGILQRHHENSKIELRDASDLKGALVKLVSLAPATSFVDVGQVGAQTYPTALTVTLSSPATVDTFVTIDSSDPASLAVPGGGVTVLAGATSAPVLVDGIMQSPSVTLTASLNTKSFMADVRVLGAGEMPVLASLTPVNAVIPPGGMGTFTVTLDIPAPVGGTSVDLVLAPANAGTIPATVVVQAGQLSATFDYTDGSVVQSATITATLGAQSFMSNLTLKALLNHLVINEVDYDQIGTDTAEFVEILNATGAPVSLAGYTLWLVNGSNDTTYNEIDLGPAGTLADQQYLVVATNAVVVPGTALRIGFAAMASNVQDKLQNGAPDAIALVDTGANKLVDALSYEGDVTAVTIPGLGMVSLVEGTALPAAVADSTTAVGSLCRIPNGTDKDNAATDWAFTSTPTPGADNVP